MPVERDAPVSVVHITLPIYQVLLTADLQVSLNVRPRRGVRLMEEVFVVGTEPEFAFSVRRPDSHTRHQSQVHRYLVGYIMNVILRILSFDKTFPESNFDAFRVELYA